MTQDLVCGVNLHYYASLQYGTAKAYIPSFVNNQILEVSLPNFYYDSNKGYSSSWISDVVDSVSNNLRNYITNNISDFGFLSFNNAYVNWAPTDLVNNWFSGSEFNLPLVCYIEDVEIQDSSSFVPDYTQILTNINMNLTNLNNKFVSNINSNSNLSISDLISKICQYTNGSSCFTIPNSYLSTNEQRNRSNIPYLILNFIRMFYSDNITIGDTPVQSSKLFEILKNELKQSVSPNASITDVISSLNTNIHNDLTNINTTENNKDTVLIIDGQQEFKLHKDDE